MKRFGVLFITMIVLFSFSLFAQSHGPGRYQVPNTPTSTRMVHSLQVQKNSVQSIARQAPGIYLLWRIVNRMAGIENPVSNTKSRFKMDQVILTLLKDPFLRQIPQSSVRTALLKALMAQDGLQRVKYLDQAVLTLSVGIGVITVHSYCQVLHKKCKSDIKGELVNGLVLLSFEILGDLAPYDALRFDVALLSSNKKWPSIVPSKAKLKDAEDVILSSNLLTTELVRYAVPTATRKDVKACITTYMEHSGLPIAAIHRMAWSVVLEYYLKKELGLSKEQTMAELGAKAGKMGLSKNLNFFGMMCRAPGQVKSPWGKCGLPSMSSGPNIDPSPVSMSRGSGYSGVSSSNTMVAPTWMIPGPCMGLNPQFIINGAAEGKEGSGGSWKGFGEAINIAGGSAAGWMVGARYGVMIGGESAGHTGAFVGAVIGAGVGYIAAHPDWAIGQAKEVGQALEKGAEKVGKVAKEVGKEITNGLEKSAEKGAWSDFMPNPDKPGTDLLTQCRTAAIDSLLHGCLNMGKSQNAKTITGASIIRCKDDYNPAAMPLGPQPIPMICTCVPAQGKAGPGGSTAGKPSKSKGKCCAQLCMAVMEHSSPTQGFGMVEGFWGKDFCKDCWTANRMCNRTSNNPDNPIFRFCRSPLGKANRMCQVVDPSPLSTLEHRFRDFLRIRTKYLPPFFKTHNGGSPR